MADKKISALPASTTPLVGTEVLPIVQGGATVQVSVANLTAGRAISATSVTASTGNFVIGTSGQGIDFSATPGTGTSELLADYEEGTFTATLTTTTGSITLSSAVNECSYTKIGRQVTVTGLIIVSSVSSPTGGISLNLPFAIGGDAESSLGGGSFVIYQDAPTYATTLQTATFEESTSVLSLGLSAALVGADDQFRFSFTYFA
jgi:hypothetical protein